MASLAAETLNLKGFRVRQWLINQFLSQKLFTRYTLRIDRTSSEIVARSNEPTFVPFFFFFSFFSLSSKHKTRNLAVLSERDSRKIARFLSIVICKRILRLFFHLQRYTIEKLCSSFFLTVYDTFFKLSMYNDRRNVKKCIERSKIENFSKKFYVETFFSSAQRAKYSSGTQNAFICSEYTVSCFFIWFSLSAQCLNVW